MQTQLSDFSDGPVAICHPFLSLVEVRGVLLQRSEGLVPFICLEYTYTAVQCQES